MISEVKLAVKKPPMIHSLLNLSPASKHKLYAFELGHNKLHVTLVLQYITNTCKYTLLTVTFSHNERMAAKAEQRNEHPYQHLSPAMHKYFGLRFNEKSHQPVAPPHTVVLIHSALSSLLQVLMYSSTSM